MAVMSDDDDAAAAARLRAALEMFDDGVAMMRQNLRRADPDAAEEEIERRLRAWLRHRPGAEHGDAVDSPSPDRSR
jgi:thiamine monophosphate synthase